MRHRTARHLPSRVLGSRPVPDSQPFVCFMALSLPWWVSRLWWFALCLYGMAALVRAWTPPLHSLALLRSGPLVQPAHCLAPVSILVRVLLDTTHSSIEPTPPGSVRSAFSTPPSSWRCSGRAATYMCRVPEDSRAATAPGAVFCGSWQDATHGRLPTAQSECAYPPSTRHSAARLRTQPPSFAPLVIPWNKPTCRRSSCCLCGISRALPCKGLASLLPACQLKPREVLPQAVMHSLSSTQVLVLNTSGPHLRTVFLMSASVRVLASVDVRI
mmetsp:Transcript_25392/g.43877  ORF Transcript_25392/g.43877 Transcript_25392/m.43877 type:complete len:272 (-) Transcript_25392:20-835(-)